MKTKMYVLAALLMASMVNVMADDDVKIKQVYPTPPAEWVEFPLNGWDSDSKGLFISSAQFSDIEVGNAIKLYLFSPGADPRVYIGGLDPTNHYPGTDYRKGFDGQMNLYVTEAMKAAIQGGDFRLYGKDLKINQVEIWRGKYTIPGEIKFGKTIWTGYFWMDDWTTLEMFKEAFNGIDLSKYSAIRFYHEAGRTDIVMNIYKDTWETGDKIADQSTMTMTDNYAELPLTDAVIEKIGGMTSKMNIQCNKESGAAFNFTDVVLMPISPDDCPNCFYVY
ncbi:MAG: hypothetical protein IJ900_00205 [Paludibacteraceae bacterium]|nr:hypothetical protein [Paludibacteraceae bacterium]